MLVVRLAVLAVFAGALGGAARARAEKLVDAATVQLGFTLRFPHPEAVTAFLAAQSNPRSPDYRHFLTPAEFGQRFGRDPAEVDQLVRSLEAAGFSVTRYPNRAFLSAVGSAAGARGLFSAQLVHDRGQPDGVHYPERPAALLFDQRQQILTVSGLDTRQHLRHRLLGQQGGTLGPQDLRAQYDLGPLLAAGFTGQGQKLMVLSTAVAPGEGPQAANIEYFLRNLSDARVKFLQNVLPNPTNDFDSQASAAATEFELDVEMQSVGAPGAESITLEVAPASQVFTVGAQDIVNNFPDVTAVSVSLGTCEALEQQNDRLTGFDEIDALRQAIQQGVSEGQTWSAASGDSGADDCQSAQSATVDFPASIPEVVAAGGTQLQAPAFDGNNAISAYQAEVVWNSQGGAAGGGVSSLFAAPSYQLPLGAGSQRLVPDLALIAGTPGAGAVTSQVGFILPVEGTSVASPLSAGFFALIASRVGCRLGQPHANLYALGEQQADGGFFDGGLPFHDITSGNNMVDSVPGQSAGPGFDSASGWGSLDVSALAAAWPPCPAVAPGLDAGFRFDGGPEPSEVYSQCGFIACDGGMDCLTLPEGPSGCVTACEPSAPSCAVGTVCLPGVLYALGDAGVCVSGCATDADCFAASGTVCDACLQTCVAPGDANAQVGDACSTNADCATAGLCVTDSAPGISFYVGGYCSQACDPRNQIAVCSCPPDSACIPSPGGSACQETCPAPGHGCGREGYQCQPQGGGVNTCQPSCQIFTGNGQSFDSCLFESGNFSNQALACDLDSGVCGGPQPYDAGPSPDAGTDAGSLPDSGVDAGTDAGPVVAADGGRADAGPSDAGPSDAGLASDGGGGAINSSCGCAPGAGSADGWAVFAVLSGALRRLRQRARSGQ